MLPGSLDQLVLDSTLGVSKIGVVCAAGASSAKFVRAISRNTHPLAFAQTPHPLSCWS